MGNRIPVPFSQRQSALSRKKLKTRDFSLPPIHAKEFDHSVYQGVLFIIFSILPRDHLTLLPSLGEATLIPDMGRGLF
jgi:hypothetical protein